MRTTRSEFLGSLAFKWQRNSGKFVFRVTGRLPDEDKKCPSSVGWAFNRRELTKLWVVTAVSHRRFSGSLLRFLPICLYKLTLYPTEEESSVLEL
jgi:hypothetical protein